MRVAAVQMNSNADVAGNLESAERLVRAAASDGAELVALPEKWSLLGPGELLAERAEPLTGVAIGSAQAWARELGIALLAGSVAERVPSEERLFNTSVLIDPDGEVVASYRKIHLFDVDVGGVSYRESEHEQGGTEIVVAEALGVPLGMTVCYDLRFGELYRILALRGAQLITVPAAFTGTTGRAHWEVLVRAGDRESALRGRARAARGRAAALRVLGPLDDRRSVGPGARCPRGRRRARDRRSRPRRARSDPLGAAGAGQPPGFHLPLAGAR
jgi:predicted amidohydrolase